MGLNSWYTASEAKRLPWNGPQTFANGSRWRRSTTVRARCDSWMANPLNPPRCRASTASVKWIQTFQPASLASPLEREYESCNQPRNRLKNLGALEQLPLLEKSP